MERMELANNIGNGGKVSTVCRQMGVHELFDQSCSTLAVRRFGVDNLLGRWLGAALCFVIV